MIETLYSARSTNGRWGVEICGPAGTTFPAQGTLRHLGRVANVESYEFVPGQTGTWVLTVDARCRVHGGATEVCCMDLQSNRFATILLVGPEAIIERFSYKDRGSSIIAYVGGERRDIPPSVLAAMGLIEAQGEIIEVAPPPALEGPMAAAFRRLKE